MLNRSNQRINYFRYLDREKFQSSESPYYFAYGRTALKAGLMACKFPTGKKVLVPEYICDAALDPFHELGIGIQYYSVKQDLSPDWDNVQAGLSKDIGGILMVHYFGIPQDTEIFIRFSEENGLTLIEDNSHGHGGRLNGKMLGLFGDIGISSPRKSFPVLNGGVLFLKNQITLPTFGTSPEPANVPKLIARDLLGRMLDLFPKVKELLLTSTDSAEDDPKIQDWCIDRQSYDRLAAYDLKETSRLRVEVYGAWEKWCRSKGLTPLFSSVSSTSAPLAMPLLFSNEQDAEKWKGIFNKNHIAAFKWPYLPKEIMETSNSGKKLHDRILCLPIHLGLKPAMVEEYLSNKFNY